MPVTVRCQCGRTYELKDEYAGKPVKCPECGTVNVAPAAGAGVPTLGDPAFDRDKFLLRQKALAIKEKYYVWDEAGQAILYVERPRYVFRGLLAAFGGLVAGPVVLLAVGGLARAKVLATLRKNYLYNVFRKRWRCFAPGGTLLCVAMEDSIILSLLRRFLGRSEEHTSALQSQFHLLFLL